MSLSGDTMVRGKIIQRVGLTSPFVQRLTALLLLGGFFITFPQVSGFNQPLMEE